MNWQRIGDRSRAVSQDIASGERNPLPGPHVALGLIDYPPLSSGGARQRGVLVYVKSSMSGDENDYVVAYKARNPAFPQESTMEQLFSEEQFEAYRALGEHIGRRFTDGTDFTRPLAATCGDASADTRNALLLAMKREKSAPWRDGEIFSSWRGSHLAPTSSFIRPRCATSASARAERVCHG